LLLWLFLQAWKLWKLFKALRVLFKTWDWKICTVASSTNTDRNANMYERLDSLNKRSCMHACTLKIFNWTTKILVWGSLFGENAPNRSQAKPRCWITFNPFNRFSLVIHQWIQLNYWKLESHQKFSNPCLGEQLGNFQKGSLLNNFWTVWPIFTSSTLIDSAKQGEQNKIIKLFKILF
jgi:hypothetical protein